MPRDEVFRKTAAGHAALRSRALRLAAPRETMALHMGRRMAERLASRIAHGP